uniref:Uncharacterized protein n=1 Tax=Chromera velia CCMP2878 TaxID=1169474 RepID=A0A0G4G2D3_9ALVE|mmetsp:Transcript_17444/g.35429  ORF Transcript_17444/g.35429 Transcript_17444/m.35429 type:complete len:390 (+) Transcript_17444:543-1712(+)|eukprot:Cvel_19943.t1-p1 / transcript=Cvel_19943.t1 / gene=Cvel_19943 / organism=Chromera_velia_CCMP2878 / gene_product=hypothetical protein / transcript_product=hypothetical protein / location=Cvel_scaffold1755:2321-3487(-) / protein_length=389 / sequence_SO=supercontig / SO=protein_coding / is_pseudo=false
MVTDSDALLLAQTFQQGRMPALRVLDLSRNQRLTEVGMVGLFEGVVESEEGLPFLEVLDLSFTKAGGGLGSLGRALASGKLKRLSQIAMRRSGVTTVAIGALEPHVRAGALAGLVSLYFSDNSEVPGEVWGDFLRAVGASERGMPKLRSLDLSARLPGAARVPGAGGVGLRAGLVWGKLKRVSRLNLKYANLTDETVRGLAAAVKAEALVGLIDLNLCGNASVSREAWMKFPQALLESNRGLPELRQLDLSQTQAGAAAPLLGRALLSKKLVQLSRINLRRSSLVAETVRYGALAGLTALSLSGNLNVGEGAWGDFLRALVECEVGQPHLRSLNLSETNAGKESAIAMALLLGRLGRLSNVTCRAPYNFTWTQRILRLLFIVVFRTDDE